MLREQARSNVPTILIYHLTSVICLLVRGAYLNPARTRPKKMAVIPIILGI